MSLRISGRLYISIHKVAGITPLWKYLNVEASSKAKRNAKPCLIRAEQGGKETCGGGFAASSEVSELRSNRLEVFMFAPNRTHRQDCGSPQEGQGADFREPIAEPCVERGRELVPDWNAVEAVRAHKKGLVLRVIEQAFDLAGGQNQAGVAVVS